MFVNEDLEVFFFWGGGGIFGFLRKKIKIKMYFFGGPNRLPHMLNATKVIFFIYGVY